jgi:uncharacterized phiE125 gp8 family phage protein
MDALLAGATKLITAPAAEPVTLAEAKTHLRVDHDAEDEEIESLITDARQDLEQGTWRALMTQTWELSLPGWPEDGRIELPYPPLQSVTWVKYTDDEGVTTTVDSSLYVVDTYAEPGVVMPKAGESWPSFSPAAANPIVVRYVAGYGDAEDVPSLLKRAMKLLIGHWYENREATVVAAGTVATELPLAVDSIVFKYQVR